MQSARSNGLAFLATLIAFVVLDAIWLLLVAGPIFQNALGPILRPQPLLAAALALYLIYSAGLLTLVVRPAIAERSIRTAAIKGGMLGLAAYAMFDLTNLAVINGWTARLAAVDIAWGVSVSAVAAVAGTAAGLRAERR